MKLNLDGFFKHLHGGRLASVYLLDSNEPLLMEEALDALNTALKNQGFLELLSLTCDTNFDFAELDSLTQNFSLFSEKKRVQLNCGEKRPKELGNWLSTYLERISEYPDLCLIIKTPKLSAAEKKAKWVTALEKSGVLVTIYEVGLQEFPRFLDTRLFREKIKLTPDARMALIEQTEGNLLAADQMLKKLTLLPQGQALTLSDVEPLLAEDARYDLFDLSRQVLLGDLKRSLRILEHLKIESEPVLVLWVLTKELKTLLTLQRKKGKVPQAELYRSLQIWDKRIKEIETGLHRLPQKAIENLLADAANIDLAIKGLKAENPWDLLKKLLVQFVTSKPS